MTRASGPGSRREDRPRTWHGDVCRRRMSRGRLALVGMAVVVAALAPIARAASRGAEAAAPAPGPSGSVPAAPGKEPDAAGASPRPSVALPEELGAQAELPGAALAEAEDLKREGLAVARQLVEDFPNSASSHLAMGVANAVAGNDAQAKACWEKCLQIDPKSAGAYHSLAEVARAEGELEKAVALWRKGLEIKPGVVDVHESLAEVLIDMGKAKEAITELKGLAARGPRSANAHFLLGQAYLQLNEYDDALQAYEKAIEIQPKHTFAHYGLSTTYTRLGQREKAQEAGATFQALKAADHEALRELRRDVANAVASLRRRVAGVHVGAAAIYARRRETSKAEPLWLRAAELDPGNIPARLQLAGLYQKAGRLPDSLRLFEQVAAIDPTNVMFRMYVGMTCVRLGRMDGAEAAFKEILRLAPDRSWGHQGLAQIYLKTQATYPEAKVHAEAAVRMDPLAANYHLLGQACEKLGDAAGALSALRRATELEPRNPTYRAEYERLKRGT